MILYAMGSTTGGLKPKNQHVTLLLQRMVTLRGDRCPDRLRPGGQRLRCVRPWDEGDGETIPALAGRRRIPKGLRRLRDSALSGREVDCEWLWPRRCQGVHQLALQDG